jgi:hypothetical protein
MEVIGTVAVRRSAQLLLIVLLALGVAWMHTFGHSQDHPVPAAGTGHMAAKAFPVMAAPDQATAAAVQLPTVKSPMPPTEPMDICLAVLTAIGFAVALVARLATRKIGSGTPTRYGPAWTTATRGPPGRIPSTARRLASLSVLRT